jgi:rubrerythrin
MAVQRSIGIRCRENAERFVIGYSEGCGMKKFRSIDEVLDFAIAKEVEAYNFYIELAEWVERAEVAKLFEDFSCEEMQHKMKLEAIKDGKIVIKEEDVGSLKIADRMETCEPKVNLTYTEALVVAMQREKKSFRLYTHLASIYAEPGVKDILLKLAQEEAQHKLYLEIEYDLTTF